MLDESSGGHSLDYLLRSPIPAEIDMERCSTIARDLDVESRKKWIDPRHAMESSNTFDGQTQQNPDSREAMKRQKFQMLF